MVARSWGALLLFLALTWTGIEVAGQDEKFSGYATAYTCERMWGMGRFPRSASQRRGARLFLPMAMLRAGFDEPGKARGPQLLLTPRGLAGSQLPPPTADRLTLPTCNAAGPGEKNSQFAGGFNACQFGRLSPYFETYFAALNVKQVGAGRWGAGCAPLRLQLLPDGVRRRYSVAGHDAVHGPRAVCCHYVQAPASALQPSPGRFRSLTCRCAGGALRCAAPARGPPGRLWW